MAAKAWKGIHAEFITVDEDDHEVHMDHSCAVAGLGGKVRADGTYDQRRDGTFEYYINEPIRYDDGKATGPFIRAALEIESMHEWLPEHLASKKLCQGTHFSLACIIYTLPTTPQLKEEVSQYTTLCTRSSHC